MECMDDKDAAGDEAVLSSLLCGEFSCTLAMFACLRARFTLLPSSDSVIPQPDYRSTAHQRQESQGRRARVRSRCTREGMERAVWWGPTGGGSGGTVTRHAPHTGLRRPRSIPAREPASGAHAGTAFTQTAMARH